MMWIRLLQRVYTPEILDTRFTTSSSTPLSQSLDSQANPSDYELSDSRGSGKSRQDGESSRIVGMTKTPEFWFYYLFVGACIPLMIKQVYDVSKKSHPNYPNFEHLLSDGWIPGRKVDNSDMQYSFFRNNLGGMVSIMLVHLLLRKAYDRFWRADTYTSVRSNTHKNSHLTHGLSVSAAADARLEQRISFDILFAIIFTVILHGFSAVKIFLILYLNYQIAKSLPRRSVPVATWVFNIAILFANELCHGYPYARLWLALSPKGSTDPHANWGAWLDSYGGLVARWEVLFNFTLLRLISFNMDYNWSQGLRGGSLIEKKQLDPSNLSERDRISLPAKSVDYSFRNYIAYVLYSPLYLAGPIITFNDYISQRRYPLPSITRARNTMYGIRFIVALLTMEIMIHYLYMVAIFHAKPSWDLYTPAQLSMLGYFHLNHIWLKLLLPWRFFRLWALLDSTDPPENMARCMSDNYSALAFWRGWHRSFNRWIVRYIYVPMGGSGQKGLWGQARSIFNYLTVFTFVALWHDLQLRLLMWGWLITLFVLPEIIGTLLFPAKRWKDSPFAYRMICGVGAVGNILMMITANLVGFALGLDGLKDLTKAIFGSYSGLSFLAIACSALFVGSQVMFEVRAAESRRGIRMKC